jgi:hypothetical protein
LLTIHLKCNTTLGVNQAVVSEICRSATRGIDIFFTHKACEGINVNDNIILSQI